MRRENRRLLLLGMLLIVTIGILAAGRQSPVLRPFITAVMAPLRPAGDFLSRGVESAVSFAQEREDYDTLLARTREMERTIAELQVEIVRLREIEQDYYRVAELAAYNAQNPEQSLVTADVIALDTSGYLRHLIINRGTRDGVQIGNPVVSDLGLVGRVENVAANEAWVRLLIDQASAVDARIQGTGAEGTVRGELQGGLRMQIPQEESVAAGDVVVTSGLGGTFPRNLVIGQVLSVRRQQGELFQEAEVRPTVVYDDLPLVSVITGFIASEPDVFEEPTDEPEVEAEQ